MFVLEGSTDEDIVIKEVEFSENTIRELTFIYGSITPDTEHYLNIFKDFPNVIVHNIFGSIEPICKYSHIYDGVLIDSYERFCHVIMEYQSINITIIIEDIAKVANGVNVMFYHIGETRIANELHSKLRELIIDNILKDL